MPSERNRIIANTIDWGSGMSTECLIAEVLDDAERPLVEALRELEVAAKYMVPFSRSLVDESAFNRAKSKARTLLAQYPEVDDV